MVNLGNMMKQAQQLQKKMSGQIVHSKKTTKNVGPNCQQFDHLQKCQTNTNKM